MNLTGRKHSTVKILKKMDSLLITPSKAYFQITFLMKQLPVMIRTYHGLIVRLKT